MKIEFRTAGTGSYTTLADDSAGAYQLKWQPRRKGIADVQQLYGQANAAVYARGNRYWEFILIVLLTDDNVSDAHTLLATLDASIPDLCDLKITQGTGITYAPACVSDTYDPEPTMGISNQIQFHWTGPNYTTTAP